MRALLLILDSVGIGGAPDAANYGDEGTNTLGHILEGSPDLRLTNLESLGLGELVSGNRSYGSYTTYRSSYGKMQERSTGKDTTTGHWEIAGIILEQPFATYERLMSWSTNPYATRAFNSRELRASGTTMPAELAPSMFAPATDPYTSADSVPNAAHEQVIGIDRLYDICTVARRPRIDSDRTRNRPPI